jgi:hypothetical protein
VKPPVFLCDRKIHEKIVSPLPDRPFFLAIIGSAGTGKTSMLINILSSKQAYRRAFHAVHVAMPPHSGASIKYNIFRRHDKMHAELDWPTLDGVREAVKASAEKGNISMLVQDDVTAALKDGDIQRALRNLIYNRRHYRLSILLQVQSYNAAPLSLRKTLSHFLLFKPRNQKESTAIFEDLIAMERTEAEALMRYVFNRPYNFLFADTGSGEVFKYFDRIAREESDSRHARPTDGEG